MTSPPTNFAEAVERSLNPTETPPDTDDSQAEDEALALEEGRDLEAEAKRTSYERSEHLRDHVKMAVVLLFWLCFGLIVLSVCTWTWHFLVPSEWHWLDKDQLDKLQTILFTLAAASGLKTVAKKHSI